MDKETVLQELRKVVDSGHELKTRMVRQSVYHWAVIYFGSWKNACAVVGAKCSGLGRKMDEDEYAVRMDEADQRKGIATEKYGVPERCKKCVWRVDAYCPLPYCIKEELDNGKC